MPMLSLLFDFFAISVDIAIKRIIIKVRLPPEEFGLSASEKRRNPYA